MPSDQGRTFHVPAHPGASSPALSTRMSGLARRDTAPELAVRRLLHRDGLRYRVAYPVPGKPRRSIDIAFTRARVAVFLDGCFWHGCPDHGVAPAANSEWWRAKLEANRSRDLDTTEHLLALDWSVHRFWEHEDSGAVAAMVRRALETRQVGEG